MLPTPRSKFDGCLFNSIVFRYVCGNENIDISKSKMILDDSFSLSSIPGAKRIPIIDDTPVSCWEDGKFEVGFIHIPKHFPDLPIPHHSLLNSLSFTGVSGSGVGVYPD